MTAKALLQAAGDGTAVPAGSVASVIRASQTTNTNIQASDTYGDLLSIALASPGVFLINSWFSINRNGATLSASQLIGLVTPNTGNNGSDAQNGVNMSIVNPLPSLTFTTYYFAMPSFLVKFDGTTITRLDDNVAMTAGGTLYLKSYLSGYSAATPQFVGKLTATRLA